MRNEYGFFIPWLLGVYPSNWLILKILLLIDTLYLIMFLYSQNSRACLSVNIISAYILSYI